MCEFSSKNLRNRLPSNGDVIVYIFLAFADNFFFKSALKNSFGSWKGTEGTEQRKANKYIAVKVQYFRVF